jgi:hypothetical protein
LPERFHAMVAGLAGSMEGCALAGESIFDAWFFTRRKEPATLDSIERRTSALIGIGVAIGILSDCLVDLPKVPELAIPNGVKRLINKL